MHFYNKTLQKQILFNINCLYLTFNGVLHVPIIGIDLKSS